MCPFPIPLSFSGAGSLSGGISSCSPIEWPLMSVCAAAGCALPSARQTAITPRQAILRESNAALDTNPAKISSYNQHILTGISVGPLSPASYASPTLGTTNLPPGKASEVLGFWQFSLARLKYSACRSGIDFSDAAPPLLTRLGSSFLPNNPPPPS